MFFIAIAAYFYMKHKIGKLLLKMEKQQTKHFMDNMHERENYARILLEKNKDTEHKLRSERVRRGQMFEQFIPFVKNFPYNRKDIRFLGSPIDMIVFNGLDEGKVKDIRIIEIKSGKSRLTQREKQIRQAINDKQVFWEEINEK
jgi:predicted Holliday junction resolvase-like endonuclease